MSTITNLEATKSTTPAYSNPVLPSPHAQLSNTAVKLSTESSIVANLGGSSSTTPLYSAVGLLNTITQAGASSATATTNTNNTTSAPSTTPATNQTSPVQSTTGSTNTNANWSKILAATPKAASALVAYTTNQGIVSSLSTSA